MQRGLTHSSPFGAGQNDTHLSGCNGHRLCADVLDDVFWHTELSLCDVDVAASNVLLGHQGSNLHPVPKLMPKFSLSNRASHIVMHCMKMEIPLPVQLQHKEATHSLIDGLLRVRFCMKPCIAELHWGHSVV